jgi:hypothetical protein
MDFALSEGVIDFALSKNLSFLKTDESKNSTLYAKTKQAFYHLHLGKLLNYIERKLKLVGIRVHGINEVDIGITTRSINESMIRFDHIFSFGQ